MKVYGFTIVFLFFSFFLGGLAEQCGRQAGNKKCPGGLCCSEFGYCGRTRPYCGKGCQSQCRVGGGNHSCAGDLDSLAANEQCGRQAGNRKCPRGLCCSEFGFCGSTRPYCGKGCQSQCKGGGAEDLDMGLAANEQCGRQAGNKKCPRGLCCSQFGFCGSTRPYCGPGCQSQCKGGGGGPDSEDLKIEYVI